MRCVSRGCGLQKAEARTCTIKSHERRSPSALTTAEALAALLVSLRVRCGAGTCWPAGAPHDAEENWRRLNSEEPSEERVRTRSEFHGGCDLCQHLCVRRAPVLQLHRLQPLAVHVHRRGGDLIRAWILLGLPRCAHEGSHEGEPSVAMVCASKMSGLPPGVGMRK